MLINKALPEPVQAALFVGRFGKKIKPLQTICEGFALFALTLFAGAG